MKNNDKLVFEKINYLIMIGGIVCIALGFLIMTMETGEYGFGFLGLTLGPSIVVIGFIIEFVAIFFTPKKK
jgi:hypothetical protein